MKRCVALLFALVLLAAAPCALAYTYTIGEEGDVLYTACTDLMREMPEEIAQAFAPLLREGDVLLAGMHAQEICEALSRPLNAAVLIAQRGDKVLLMGANKGSGTWQATLESDSFIPMGSDFSITYLPEKIYPGKMNRIAESFAIILGNEIWGIHVDYSGALYMQSMTRQTDDGEMVIWVTRSSLKRKTFSGENYQEDCWVDCSVPRRLCAWTQGSFPVEVEAIRQFSEANQFRLAEGQAYIKSVNFREKPTGQSRSMGEYTARGQVLGSQPGKDAPWIHVQIGDTQGWVSGVYVTDSSAQPDSYAALGSVILPVARVDTETALRLSPDGETKQMIPAGTTMHVLMNKDGWLHVIIPRGEITWRTDWDGTYGYIRADEAVLGGTLDQLKYQ